MNPWYKQEKWPLSKLLMKVAILRCKQLRNKYEEFMKSKESKEIMEEFFFVCICF